MHVILEHLLHIELGSFRLKRHDTAHRVFFSSVAHVAWSGLVLHAWVRLAKLQGHLEDVLVLDIPGFGEVIAVVDQAVTAVNGDSLATFEIFWGVVLFSAERHAWAVSQDGRLGKLLLLKKHWEWESATVLGVDLLDLDGVVLEEVVQTVVLLTTVVTAVLPENFEGKYLAVVVKETFQILVRAATFQFDFVVVLVFSQIGRVLLHVDHGTSLGERIVGEVLRAADVNAFVGVECLGELIRVNDAENTGVDIQVLAELEVRPVIGSTGWVWQLVSLKEDALRDSSVLNAALNDVDGVVVEVVVEDALADPVVLVGVFNNWLLEVGFEVKHLKVTVRSQLSI